MDNKIPVPPLPGGEQNNQNDNLGNNNALSKQNESTGSKIKKIILIIVVIFVILVVGIFASIFIVGIHSARKDAKNVREKIMINTEKQNKINKLETNNAKVETFDATKVSSETDVKINADNSSNVTIGNKQISDNKNIKKYCNLRNKIQFDNKDFVLAWSNEVVEGDYLLEYVPLGDDVEHYHDMLTIECVVNDKITVDNLVSIFVKNLDKEKQNDPFVHYEIYTNDNNNSKLVDALLKDGDIIEWNIFRYQFLRSLIGKKGVIRFGFSKRVYEDEPQMGFIKGLKETRHKYITVMSSVELENIFENKK